MVKAAAGYNTRPVLRTSYRLGTYKTVHWTVLGPRRTRRTHGPEVRLRASRPFDFAKTPISRAQNNIGFALLAIENHF